MKKNSQNLITNLLFGLVSIDLVLFFSFPTIFGHLYIPLLLVGVILVLVLELSHQVILTQIIYLIGLMGVLTFFNLPILVNRIWMWIYLYLIFEVILFLFGKRLFSLYNYVFLKIKLKLKISGKTYAKIVVMGGLLLGLLSAHQHLFEYYFWLYPEKQFSFLYKDFNKLFLADGLILLLFAASLFFYKCRKRFLNVCLTFFLLLIVNFYFWKFFSLHRIYGYNRHKTFVSLIKPAKSSSPRHDTWSYINVYGHNFGNAEYEYGKVVLSGVEHRVIKWSDDEIVFILEPNKSENGEFYVINYQGKKSNSVNFDYIK